MEQEQILLALNHQGKDYHVVVDLATAEILLNDANKAEKYLTSLLRSQNNDNNDVGPSSALEQAVECSTETSNVVWKGKGRPTAHDEEATEMLLKLRETYSAQFDNKKTIKAQLWNKIAEELTAAGFNCGIGKDAGERCRQKFANLQKLYLNHKQQIKKTGEAKKEPPPFFELVHSILGDKDKVNPKNMIDTEESETDNNKDTETSTPSPSTSSGIKNCFSSVSNLQRNKSMSSHILDAMNKQHRENQEERRMEFATLQKILEQQNEQRQEMLNLFKVMVKNKKRKRVSSDEDSDEYN